MAGTAPALASYLARHTPVAETEVAWRDGAVRLRVTSYLSEELPPLEHISSVRCIVFRGDSVLVVREGDSAHVVPGGRREAGETLRQTLARELLEETGWTVERPRLAGVVRLRHLGPRPPDIPTASPLYPDFLWVIYAAEADEHRPEALLPGSPEGVASFVPLAEVDALGLGPESRIFLEHALRALRDASPA